MTAPEPLVDLPARLLAAIEETASIARAAADGDSGRWIVGRKDNVYRAEDETPWDDYESNKLVVWGNVASQSEHIAHNDPATVLRRCPADRRLVERHQREVETMRWFPTDDQGNGEYRDVEYCVACTLGNGCDHCISWTGDSFVSGPAVLWPCPTLQDLAGVYGITEEAA